MSEPTERRILRMRGTLFSLGLLMLVPVVGYGQGFEQNMDRPGSDYRDFDLARPEPALCQAACEHEGQCKAWTYVKPGIQGPSARCWLKGEVPEPVENDGCVSGVKGAGGVRQAMGMEADTNRPGSDYRDFDLPRPAPALCQAACEREGQCKAWTYVKPGVQGPSARCWLKSQMPEPVKSDCCVSGVK